MEIVARDGLIQRGNQQLDSCFVPDQLVLGDPGIYPRERWQARFYLSFAAQYLGGAEGVFDFLTDYLSKRGTVGDSLVTAIAALGVKTSLQDFASLGWRPVALLVGDTLFLVALFLSALLLRV